MLQRERMESKLCFKIYKKRKSLMPRLKEIINARFLHLQQLFTVSFFLKIPYLLYLKCAPLWLKSLSELVILWHFVIWFHTLNILNIYSFSIKISNRNCQVFPAKTKLNLTISRFSNYYRNSKLFTKTCKLSWQHFVYFLNCNGGWVDVIVF